MKTVLFLCSGNYYRSRFAEIFFNWHAAQRALGWRADSRGLALHAANVGPISRHAHDYLTTHGILSDACSRFPLAVLDADFAAAHRIIAVKEAEHRLRRIERKLSRNTSGSSLWPEPEVMSAEPDA